MSLVLDVHNLTVFRNSKKVFDNFNFQVNSGTLVTLTGSNGSGKSTLIKSVLGLIPFSGHVHRHTNEIGYLPQSHLIDRSFPVTVREFISFGFRNKTKDDAVVESILNQIAITHLSDQLLSDLSQGEFQKVLLARSLVESPKLLVLDEPFSNIDEKAAEVLKDNLLKRKNAGTAILLSIHDSKFVKSYSDQIIPLGGDNSHFVDHCMHDHGES
ncbi:MAG: metal ABC transporter ATP-binding protein [Bdellovibrionaceae bacterium]|nr:metal ABC transporter ATP-binding protein [Pseudobdellovibrionaceae bacterium]